MLIEVAPWMLDPVLSLAFALHNNKGTYKEEHEKKQKLPTAAHHVVAAMVASGHFRVIVTTNFDRLLEQALLGREPRNSELIASG